jgi:C-terminal processing protease CtpA/Prc
VKDAARRLAAPLLALVAAACTGLLVGTDAANTPASVFDNVWTALDRDYALFALRGVDWDAARNTWRPQAIAAATDQQLYAVIAQMLQSLHDPHVVLYRPDGTEIRSRDIESAPASFALEAVRTYVPDLRLTGHGVIYGMIGSDLGYVRMSSFNGANGGEIDEALAFLGSPAGMIVDLRGNLGGYVSNAEFAATRFMDRPRRYRFVRYRNGPAHDDLTPLEAVSISPAGPRQYTGPVVVLTDRQSASATEDFVLAMRVRPGTVMLGDTTAGALSIPLLHELPGGALLRVPQAIVYDLLQASWEGTGLAPTSVVPNTKPPSATRDFPVEVAIARLRAAALR